MQQNDLGYKQKNHSDPYSFFSFSVYDFWQQNHLGDLSFEIPQYNVLQIN